MDALIKASLYIGTILLVGAGGYLFFIAHSDRTRVLVVCAFLGFILLSAGSVANLAQTVTNVLGRFDTDFIWQYATSTQHGRMTFIRLGLAVVLLILLLLHKQQPLEARLKSRVGTRPPKAVSFETNNIDFNTHLYGGQSPPYENQKTYLTHIKIFFFSLASLGLFYTFSVLSHATTMRGEVATLADMLHFSSATLWVGAVLFSVLHKSWNTPDFESVMKRVSSLALVSVALLVSTGIYASLIHINTWALLFNTPYGRILFVKVCVFSLILVLAALNRWYFMPRLLRHSATFRYALMLESGLLLLVLVITGILTVSPVPHDM